VDDLAVLVGVERVGGVVGEEPRGDEVGEGVGELEGNPFVFGNRLSEGHALERPVARDAQRALRGAAAACCDEQTLDEEPFLCALVAARGHAVLVGHAAVAEDELGVVVEIRVVQEARDARELESWSAGLDDEERLLAVDDRENDVEAWVALARHKPLLAVQHPLVAVAHGRRGDRAHVRAGVGLRDRPGLAVLAPQDGNDPAVALLGREDLPELGRAAVDDGEAKPVRGLAGFLLERHLADHAEAGTSGVLRHVQHGEARSACLLAHCVDGGEVDRSGGGDLLFQREDLVGDEAADAPFQLCDVGGKLGDDHGG